MALIFSKSADDKALILGTRESLIYPFVAPNWTDLRLGMFLSLTKDSVDDDASGLGETLTKTTYGDRAFLGFKDNSDDIPSTAGTVFAGLMSEQPFNTADPTKLSPSTGGSATSGTIFWRLHSSPTDPRIFPYIIDGATVNFQSFGTTGVYLPQDPVAAGGYALLFLLRITRSSPSSLTIAISGANSSELNASWNAAYSNTPTISAIRSTLRTFPYTNSGGVTVSAVPTTIYAHWPFFNSRLRIHALALEKFA